MGKRVLIIGAGIAGLSAASYLQRNGFQAELFEMHSSVGGLCTSWKRNGFTFDGCVHWLMGSGPSSNVFEIWKELGAGNLEFHEWDVYTVVRLRGGDSFTVYTDPDLLEAEMLRLGPQDAALIRKMVNNIRRVSHIDQPVAWQKIPLKELLCLVLRLPAALPVLTTWMKRPLGDLVSQFNSPQLREAFKLLYGDLLADFPAAGWFLMLGFMAKRSNGYPIGGSSALAGALENKARALGVNIHCRSKIDEIVIRDGKVVGVRGTWGEMSGDYVISAADAWTTMHHLLGGRYHHPVLDAAFAAEALGNAKSGTLRRFPSLIYVCFGFSADCRTQPHTQVFPLDPPLVLEEGALRIDRFSLRFFHFDPTMAPAGKTVAVVSLETYHDEYWTSRRDRRDGSYQAAKDAVSAAVMAIIERHLPGFAQSVETTDVATPATFQRYTNNWHGSYEGWLPTSRSFGTKVPRVIDGVDNFYMIGQWLNPGGGLPPCAIDGRLIARTICRREHRRFRSD